MLQECRSEWRDSDARSYCSGATIGASGVGMTPSEWGCDVSATCSITVDVDDTSTTFTPSVDDHFPTADVDDLDICFAEDSTATSGFTASVKAGCASTETDSGDAVDDGLSTGD